jgi:hypothetical protein
VSTQPSPRAAGDQDTRTNIAISRILSRMSVADWRGTYSECCDSVAMRIRNAQFL